MSVRSRLRSPLQNFFNAFPNGDLLLQGRVGTGQFLVPLGDFFRALGECLLHPLAFGDVEGDAAGADASSRGVAQGQFGGQDPVDGAVHPGFLLFDIQQRLAGADDFLLVGQGLLRVLAGEKIRIRFADELGRITQPKLPGMGAVHPQKTTGRILEVNGGGNVIHQSRHQGLFVAQRRFRLLALGDVMSDSYQATNPPLAVPKRQFGRQHRVLPAIRKNHAVFTVNKRLPGKNLQLLGAELGGQSGREKVRVGQAKHLVGRLFAGLFRQGFVDHQKTAVQNL